MNRFDALLWGDDSSAADDNDQRKTNTEPEPCNKMVLEQTSTSLTTSEIEELIDKRLKNVREEILSEINLSINEQHKSRNANTNSVFFPNDAYLHNNGYIVDTDNPEIIKLSTKLDEANKRIQELEDELHNKQSECKMCKNYSKELEKSRKLEQELRARIDELEDKLQKKDKNIEIDELEDKLQKKDKNIEIDNYEKSTKKSNLNEFENFSREKLKSMSLADLRGIAKKKKIELKRFSTKPDLVRAISSSSSKKALHSKHKSKKNLYENKKIQKSNSDGLLNLSRRELQDMAEENGLEVSLLDSADVIRENIQKHQRDIT